MFQFRFFASGSVPGVALVCLALAISACGSNGNPQLVRDVSLKTFKLGDDLYVEMTVEVQTGNLIFPAIDLPIWKANQPDVIYGQVSLRPLFGEGGEIKVAVNLSETAKDEIADPLLPNGRPIPIGGLDEASIAALNIGNGNSRLYFAFGQDSAVLGVAVVIDQFDEIGSRLGAINIFPSFKVGQGVIGSAGIFTGAKPGSSGIAVFADISSLLDNEMEPLLMARERFRADGVVAPSGLFRATRIASPYLGRVRVLKQDPGRRSRENVYYRLWRMDRRGGRMTTH